MGLWSVVGSVQVEQEDQPDVGKFFEACSPSSVVREFKEFERAREPGSKRITESDRRERDEGCCRSIHRDAPES